MPGGPKAGGKVVGPPTSPLVAREDFIAVPGARLFVREVGAGVPLVVIHGGPDFNHRYLLPEMDELASRYRLIYYDQRGRGKSSDGVRPDDVTIDSEIADLDRLRQHLGLEAVALLGHSWGCLLAMEYTARHPDRVDHLILMNTAPASHADMLRFRQHRQADHPERLTRMREIAATAAYASGDVAVEADYYRIHFGATLRDPRTLETVVERLRVDFTPAGIIQARAIEDRLYEQTWLRPDYDVGRELVRTRAPLLVLHGDHDFIPTDCARSIAGAVPGARFALISDCGHFAYMERSSETLELIRSFLVR
jgi:proline iminopeptidase